MYKRKRPIPGFARISQTDKNSEKRVSMKPQGSDARPQPTSHSDGKGGAYVVLDTPVVDEKGKVIGTEPRRYALLKSGRNLVVEEEGPPPTQQDKDDLHKFLHMAKVERFAFFSSPLSTFSSPF